MKPLDTVTIIGVGLIGGSIGLALRRRGLAREIVGVGRRQSSLRIARQRGAITSGTLHLDRGVANAELIVVCTPVDCIVDHVHAAADACPDDTLITDAGSTKAEIVEQLNGSLPDGARFLGSHPLAGSERSGPQFAQSDLFDKRQVIITPTRATRKQDRLRIKRFWSSLGAHVIEMSPSEHDRAVAAVSHLPHLVSAVMAASTTKKDLPHVASGWLDTTRIAAGDPHLWTEILLSNPDHVLKSLERFEKLMSSARKAIKEGNNRKLKKLLADAQRIREQAGG